MSIVTRNVNDIQFIEALYPRRNYDEKTVNQYLQAIDDLPPILITADNRIIDGYHRLIAHRIENKETIRVEISPLSDDTEILKESIRLNASHGKQLTPDDKKTLARTLFETGMNGKELSGLLSVNASTISRWTVDLRLAQDNTRDAKIMELWLACKTQEEIAEAVGLERSSVTKIVNKLQMQEIHNPPDSLQVFNLWNFAGSGNDLKYPGQIPTGVMENLLWYFTNPFDVVYDPFAGSGMTGKVCIEMRRRHQLSDIAPVDHRITQHDITTGFPDGLMTPDFIFLDPPYSQMLKGKYTDLDTDFSNMDLQGFYDACDRLAECCFKSLKDGGHVAFIISASQTDEGYFDHA